MNFKLPCFFLILWCFHLAVPGHAAPANDDCSKAFPLLKVNNWCSAPRQFTNYAATPSGMDGPGCFPSFFTDEDNDVWFKFTAIANVANISVIGAIPNKPSGTLQFPQFVVYSGSCSEGLRQIACISDARGYHIVETFVGGLAVGATYYLRVDARNNRTGTFQLCINNFNPIPSPSSDCNTAVILCDKSPFTVPSVTNAGKYREELTPGLCLPEETQSVWYKWTCDKPGSLSFTLKPINPSDDLDFVVFALGESVNGCSFKTPVRCMAAGENVGAPYSSWAKCSGSTGLRSGSLDGMEEQGCNENQDNFLAPLQMEAGRSYALLVNNYHNTGNGFTIEFGGTGTFVGPVAHFTMSQLKIEKGKTLTVNDASTFSGGFSSWEWNFGVGASPQTAKGIGPHSVKYNSSGKKSISLSVLTANGCKVTKVRTLEVSAAPAPKPKEPVKPKPALKPETPPSVLSEVPAPKTESSEIPTGAASAQESVPEPIAPVAVAQQEKETEEVMVTQSGSDVVQKIVTYDVKFVATVYFKADSASLQQKDYATLEEVAQLLRQHPKHIAIVEGHTNSIPTDDYCLKLGAARAGAAMRYLREQGVAEHRIYRKVFGKKNVVVKDNSLQGRRLNQRVEIKIVDRGG